MQAIQLTEFNGYILGHRCIFGKEVAWFKSNTTPVKLLGVLIDCQEEYEAVIYKLRRGNFYELAQMQKFESRAAAYDFLQYELTY